MGDSDESILNEPYRPFYNIFASKPVLVKQDNDYNRAAFKERPLLGVLLFDNVASEARDIAANERTFLSWLKLSVYMSIVAVAIILNFHWKSGPSALEVVAPAGHCVLAAFVGMPVVWSVQLYKHGLRLQSSTSARSNRVEDSNRVHGGCSSDRGQLHLVAIDKCTKPVDDT
ncbi:hypothetical protein OPT61_g4188 [Boeremia exigua]|uniref:Uncharacterized protein n=1 Tax=Boeremia exigua TaxID=749465 RepID=A0ACC2IEX4_9PLEO|nr:hypothetical protein OPT61_g4188 [Boeremia exigua]